MKKDGFTGMDQMPFAVARIRARENTLLSDQDLGNLLAGSSYHASIQYLLDRGWGPTEHDTPEELIVLERERLWELVNEILNPEQRKIMDIFRIEKDFHNVKAAIKESYVQRDIPNIYLQDGTIPLQMIRHCAAEGEFDTLPRIMGEAAIRGRDALFQAGDPQLCDVILDRACLESVHNTAEASGNALLKEYAKLKCDAANINIVIRALKAGKDEDFLLEALIPFGSLSIQQLLAAYRNGLEQVYEYLESTSYYDCVEEIRKSPAAFDRWCDNRMIRMLRPQKYNAFTVSPVIAFVLAKEYEIRSVRLILSGKRNHLDEEKIRERLRESYV